MTVSWKVSFIVATLLLFGAGESEKETTTPQAGSENAPAWMLSLEDSFPRVSYMAAIGDGNALAEAQQLALGNLVTSFKTRVQGSVRAEQSFSSSGSGANASSQRSSALSNTIERDVDQSVQGVLYSEPYTRSDGRVFVVAYIERENTGRLYRQQIEGNNELIEKRLQRALDEESLLISYSLLMKTQALVEENEELMAQLAVINQQQQRFIRQNYDVSQLEKLQSDYAARLPFSVEFDEGADSFGELSKLIAQDLLDFGLPQSVKQEAVLVIKGALKTEAVELNNGYKNIFWQLNVTLKDDKDQTIIEYNDQGRESGRSQEQARLSLFKMLSKKIGREFNKEFQNYLERVG